MRSYQHNRLLYKVVFVLFICLVSISANAAHLKGGYVEYKYLGPTPNKAGYKDFEITVYQYLDCGSIGGQIDLDISVGVYDAKTGDSLFTKRPGIGAPKFIRNGAFECIVNPPDICYRIDNYRFTISVPDNSNGIVLDVQRCCRVIGIKNIYNSSNTGVTYTITLFPSLTGSGLVENSSPVFSQDDAVLVCANNFFTYPFKAIDPDGDSLVFRFTPGLNTATRDAKPDPPATAPEIPNLVYSGDFDAEFPLGSKVTIDPKTGLVSGIAPTEAGDYVLAVIAEEYRNGEKIAETRKELHVTVGNCDIVKATLPATIINCDSFAVSFQNASSSSAINSYFWDFGVKNSNADTSTSPTPTFNYKDTGVYQAKLVVNKGGFCPDSAYATVSVFPGFTADFDYTSVCLKLPFDFKDKSVTSYGSINKWHWDFGEPVLRNDTSDLKNPSYKYNTEGTYPVTLTVGSDKGCTDVVTKSIEAGNIPKLNLSVTDTVICRNDSLTIYSSIPGNYTWTPGTDIINANTASPTVFPKSSTTYYVTLLNLGCSATDSVRVNVVGSITVDAGNDTTICQGDAITLHPTSLASAYSWTPTTLLDDATSRNPVVTATDPSVTLTVNAALGSCKASDVITIRTAPYPVVNAGNDTTVCYNTPVLLHGSGTAGRYAWSTVGTLGNATSLNTNAVLASSGYIFLTGTNSSGCTKPVTDSLYITVIPQINVFAGNDTTIVVDQPLQLNGQSNASIAKWAPATGISDPDIFNPILQLSLDMAPNAAQTATYTLTAEESGCTASHDIVIRVFKTLPSIFVPSGFTPDGNGLNDVIRPILAGVKELQYFRIYNRYGQLVYETKTAGAGWDGKIKGQLQATNSFVYDCSVTDYLGKPLRAKGSFVLIR